MAEKLPEFEPMVNRGPGTHSPLPWGIEGPDEFGDWNILHPNETACIGAIISNGRPSGEVAANALLVHQAVNSHARLVECLEELHRPHLLFCIHAHVDGGWIWEGDDGIEFVQHGGFPWTTDEDVRELMLSEYRDRLERLINGQDTSAGLVLGTIPITIGKHREDPPWEAVIEDTFIWPLDEGEPFALTAKARALIKENSHEQG